MLLFSRNKEVDVQRFVLHVVNNNCPELEALIDGPRLDRRANLTLVVQIIPLQDDCPKLDAAFYAVTKEFSCTGLAVVLDEPRGLDEVIVALRSEGEMTFARGKAKHLSPLGGGFYQLGFHLTEIVHATDYPGLRSVNF